ncbi:glycoside hydrolase 43 family protein [Vallitalea longa]|uniref:Glycoside hydrolase 43 family protein n=1 Tax=Vallitalea longa TaxID=2936439 RepID=A0A9W5YE69_9FIRM|nr:glycoside hydrolase family 43 protein [Vallitalea longa]GKX30698.1 glycoside hydrolase 43 family protein [Vallitalea longa]
MIENPILPGFNPDPSIICVGDIYYIATSTFEWFPGIPIYKSKDLKNWKLVNHAVKKTSQVNLKGIDSALGIWAPALSYDESTKKFYLCFSVVSGAMNNNFDVDNYVIETEDIEKEWSEPVYLNSSGFDPAMFHDDDGRKWVVNLEWDFREGYEHPGAIVIEEYNPITKTLVGGSRVISRGGTDRGCLEGPQLYKRGKYYYLITAEGGTGYGHCVAILRSTNVLGPYESYEHNPIITSQPVDFNERGIENSAKPHHYNPDSYLQKSGHGNIVETQTGEVYMSHLCSRPIGELCSVLGRETAIQKCIWTDDDWIKLDSEDNLAKRFVVEPNLTEHKWMTGSDTDHFDSTKLDMDYYTLREPISKSWLSLEKDSFLSIRGRQTMFSRYDQSLVAKRVKSFNFTAETHMYFEPDNFLQMAGLTNYYNNNSFYYLRLYYSESLGSMVLGIMASIDGHKKEYLDSRVKVLNVKNGIFLKCEIEQTVLQYYYSFGNNDWIEIGPKLDYLVLSDEHAKGFTGSFVGLSVQDMYKRKKWADFDYFIYKDL